MPGITVPPTDMHVPAGAIIFSESPEAVVYSTGFLAFLDYLRFLSMVHL